MLDVKISSDIRTLWLSYANREVSLCPRAEGVPNKNQKEMMRSLSTLKIFLEMNCPYIFLGKMKSDNTKTPPKFSITQRLRTDLGWSVQVTKATHLVCFDQCTVSQPSN